MRIKLILFILFLFYIANPVLAGDSPILTSPANNSTILSIPTFSWQAVSGSTGYNILIDDEATVTSPYAKTPYYPTNPSYSPQTLNPGTYYWKVKVKDSNGNWGSFSNIWSFILVSADPTPTPTPTPAPVPSSPSSSFTISGPPSQINSDQSFNVSVNLSLTDNPNTNFYLKGAFKKQEGSNYFGLTKVSGSWIKNSSSYTSQYLIKTDSSGNWSGTLEVQPDADDSGYTGTDDYIFKVGEYNSTDVNPSVSWSNEVSIKIIGAATSNSSSNSNPSTTKSSINPTSSPKITTAKTTNTTSSKTSKKQDYQIASVAGVTTSISASPSATAEVKSERRNFIPWIGGIFVLAGISSLIFIYLRARKKNETIYYQF